VGHRRRRERPHDQPPLREGQRVPETILGSITYRIVRQQLVPLRKDVAARSATIKALADLLAKSSDINPAAIEAAVSAGVSKVLGNLEVTVTKGD
jgi:hypothetical protein